MNSIEVSLPIKLGQFVKLASLAETGGQAREMIEMGDITVNGQVETHRGHRPQQRRYRLPYSGRRRNRRRGSRDLDEAMTPQQYLQV